MSLSDWLERCCDERGHHTALIAGERRISYIELRRLVRRLAYSLDQLGLEKGEVVAVQLPNLIELVVAYLAITSRGAIMQTVHMPYRAAEISSLLAHSGAVAAIVLAEAKDYRAAQLLLDLRAELPRLQHVLAVGASASVPAGALDFSSLMSTEGELAPLALAERDPFLLLYTSGTMSAPKGVLHTYANFLGNSARSAEALSIDERDVLLCAAPFTHLYGLFTLNMALSVGAASLLLPAFTPPDLARLMTGGVASVAFTAPAHIAACMNQSLFEGGDLSSLRYVQISGSAVPPELGRAFEPHLKGGKVMQLWGMTELQAGAFTRLDDSEVVRIETTGRPSPGTELRVMRDDGTIASIAANDEIGELQMRGPSLFDGYLNNPEASAAAFTADGWFRTGDLACQDAQGNIRLAGRTKEIINRGGVKFNPLDVENVLSRHAAINEVAIVALPDAVLGERACAFVTLKPAHSFDFEQMQAWLEQHRISKIKWPERLEVIEAMPLTPTRKIMKGELVKRARSPQ